MSGHQSSLFEMAVAKCLRHTEETNRINRALPLPIWCQANHCPGNAMVRQRACSSTVRAGDS